MLELDTTTTRFRDHRPGEPLDIQGRVAHDDGRVRVPEMPAIGVIPDPRIVDRHEIGA